jgi:hypothetical protein
MGDSVFRVHQSALICVCLFNYSVVNLFYMSLTVSAVELNVLLVTLSTFQLPMGISGIGEKQTNWG